MNQTLRTYPTRREAVLKNYKRILLATISAQGRCKKKMLMASLQILSQMKSDTAFQALQGLLAAAYGANTKQLISHPKSKRLLIQATNLAIEESRKSLSLMVSLVRSHSIKCAEKPKTQASMESYQTLALFQ